MALNRLALSQAAPGRMEKDAARQMLPFDPEPNYILGNTLTYLEECPDLKGIKVFRLGLHLAEIRGKHMVPDHAFAYYAAKQIQRTELRPENALQYMAGEEVPGKEATEKSKIITPKACGTPD